MTLSARDDAQQPDGALIAQANAGKRRAFDELMRRHESRMTNLACRTMGNSADAEDAVQEAMAAAWFKLGQFDQSLPFGPWVTRIVLNKCRDQLRKRKVMRIFDFGADNEVEQVAADSPDQQESAEAAQSLQFVQKEISNLPTRLREALVLVTFDGQSQAEAATILGTTEKAIETRIYRARNRLREKLKSLRDSAPPFRTNSM